MDQSLDSWFVPNEESIELKTIETVERKSILNRSKIEYVDWGLNPFIGCNHACQYCYARDIDLRFKKVGSKAEWHRPKLVKNYMQLIEKNIDKVGKNEEIFISTMTDIVGADIHNQNVLRNIVMRLQEADLRYRILTKSPDIVKDIDVLHYGKGKVGLSITTNSSNKDAVKKWEPRTARIFKRLQALESLRNEKTIPVWISAEPFLPGTDFQEYVKEINLWGGDLLEEVIFGKMNYVKGMDEQFRWQGAVFYLEEYRKFHPRIKVHYKSQFSKFLLKHHPTLVPKGGFP